MSDKRLHDQLDLVAALEEPVRRDLYLYVSRQGSPVGRDQAAHALHLSRSLAAFHLDRLVETGLLETSFRRLSGRQGPGAGRPSKLYQRSSRQVELTLPERRYQLAGELLAQALSGEYGEKGRAALRRDAHERGRRMGEEGKTRSRTLQGALALLRESGFEPERERSGRIVLKNCPFDALAHESREVVCGMNQALVQGMVEGLGLEDADVVLHPAPGRCCVVLRAKGAA
jgi:predicted ArsR family transcriptional regulator